MDGADAQEEGSGICPHCKMKNPTGYLFCFNCNQSVSDAPTERARTDGILNIIVSDARLRGQLEALLEKAHKKSVTAEMRL